MSLAYLRKFSSRHRDFSQSRIAGRAGAVVGGEDLQHRPAVLEQGELPGFAVLLELHLLLSPGDLAGLAADGDRGQDRQHRRDSQRCPPVGHPVHLLLAAVLEDLRVGAAAVEADHDLRARPGGLLQLGQRLRQGHGQPGRLAGHEAHRPPVVRGDVRVRAAFLCPAPLVVPPLADRFRPGVGDEVVIDVVHPGQHRVGGEHRGGEHPLQPQRVGAVGDAGQRRAQGPQVRQRRQPGQRPGLSRGQVLELLGGRLPQREAGADGRQQARCGRQAARRRGQHVRGAGARPERVQQHRPRIAGPHPALNGRPAAPGTRPPPAPSPAAPTPSPGGTAGAGGTPTGPGTASGPGTWPASSGAAAGPGASSGGPGSAVPGGFLPGS